MDLSVVHHNTAAIALYEKLGFQRIPVLCIKRKNAINEPLFTAITPETVDDLNPYARIIADEALRRGIQVEVLDAETGELRLSYGGRSVITRESLSEFTSAVAMSRCDDKRRTRRMAVEPGITVPPGRLATFDDQDHAFLDEVGDVVVKPTRGEQGKGITVGVDGDAELNAALARAREHCPEVLIEQRAHGDDLRRVVIDGKVIAAAIRMPAEIIGTGRHTVRDLIEVESRRRAAATGGESHIPLDDVTEGTVREAGWSYHDVLPEGTRLRVRRTANLHQGGTIHDVTAKVSPELCRVAVKMADALGIPVTGIDLLVPNVTEDDYVFVEANERPGLANHEPQPRPQRSSTICFPGIRDCHRPGLRNQLRNRHSPRQPQPSPGAGAQHDLGGQLRGRLLCVAPARQIDQPEIAVDEALARPGDRAGSRRADQRGGVDLHRRAVLVANHTGHVGDAWVAAVDHHQADEPVQATGRQLPREFAAHSVADQ
jgi:GNAT-family acetyltransferase (TIGR03103 family)